MVLIKNLKCLIGLHKWLPMPYQKNVEWCDWCVKIRRVKVPTIPTKERK